MIEPNEARGPENKIRAEKVENTVALERAEWRERTKRFERAVECEGAESSE